MARVLEQAASGELADLRTYQPYRPGSAAHPQEGYYEPDSMKLLAEEARAIVEAEAPLLEELAVSRLGERWDFRRMAAKATARALEGIAAAGCHLEEADGERVLWPSPEAASGWSGCRVPASSGSSVSSGTDRAKPEESEAAGERAILEVPLAELRGLLVFWIGHAGPMGVRDLFDHASRTLGYGSLGARIRERLEAALTSCREAGRLEVRDEVVRLGES